MVIRPCKAFLIFCYFGFFGISPDIDHILCIWLDMGTFDPTKGEFGCRLYHAYIIPIVWCCIILICTSLIGLWLGCVGFTIQRCIYEFKNAVVSESYWNRYFSDIHTKTNRNTNRRRN